METTWDDSYREDCPARLVLGMVGDKWTLLTISALGDGAVRFADLRRRLAGISQKVLTATLRAMERDGLVDRTVHPTTPPSVEYALTELGRGVRVPLEALQVWAEHNTAAVEAARTRFDSR
ncbi:helix-turn-helix domain-containing protein [Longispora sp. NPDC051575]|uniref:winged helix-turn-helix transcriptional regulator n=1 Tax=Longispora sp. NPDC051575 TaxID=3154943 RepID=UPI003432D433